MNLELTVLADISGCATTPNPNGSFVSETSIVLSWAAVAHRLARIQQSSSSSDPPVSAALTFGYRHVLTHAELFPGH